MTDQNRWLTSSQTTIATEQAYAQGQFEYIQKPFQDHRPV